VVNGTAADLGAGRRRSLVINAVAVRKPEASRMATAPGPTRGGRKERQPDSVAPPKPERDMNQLHVEDLEIGDGAEAVRGATLSVHYVGTLDNGKKFDSSRDRGTPFSFKLGAGAVIPGWDRGVVGMRVGGKRKLIIPSTLAYGDRGFPGLIPPRATLTFEIELMGVSGVDA